MTVQPDIDVDVYSQPDGAYKAIDRNTYDCDHNGESFFEIGPVGYGPTPLDAIIDLLDNMEPVR